MKRDPSLDENIDKMMEGRCDPKKSATANAAIIAWALDRVAMGLGEVAEAIRGLRDKSPEEK